MVNDDADPSDGGDHQLGLPSGDNDPRKRPIVSSAAKGVFHA